MTKRNLTKLFAVVTLATSLPMAAAGPAHDHGRGEPAPAARPDPWAGDGVPGRIPAVAPTAEAIGSAVLAVLGISKPRELPSGAPACGNVATRAPRPASCE
jgi:hypothetical protein